MTSHSENYRPEIDGLRALAVIAVIINHFNKSLLPNGFLGVDIFFVISGYVITSSLASKESISLRNFLLGFYSRRIKRIMPALIVCISITSVVGFMFIPVPMQLMNILSTGIAALFGYSNIDLFKIGTYYFATSTELNLFTQTWSLGVEEQFYLIFPLIFWFSGFARKVANGKRNLLFSMILFSVMSLCIYVWLSVYHISAAYFLIPARFWELGMGCIICLVLLSKKQLPYIVKFVSPLLITTLLIVILIIPNVPIYEFTIAVVLLTSLLIATLNYNSIIFKVFTLYPVVFIGQISYSLYLWHWSILAISRWTIGICWWTIPIQIGLILLIAYLSYQYIEKKLRYITWSTSQFTTISYGIGASIIVSVLLFLLGNPFKGVLYIGYPSDFLRSWVKDVNGNYIEYCHVQEKYSEKIFNDCITDKIKTKKKQNNIYIFGDSHARNYLNGIKIAFSEYNVLYITMGYGCAFTPDIPPYVASHTKCKEYVSRVKDFIKNDVKVNDVVFIGQSRAHQFDIGYQENIFEVATNLQHKGAKLVLLADIPGLEQDPASYCMKQPWRHQQPKECFKTVNDVILEQDKLDKIGLLLQTKMSNSRYLNVRSHLCVNQLCSLYKGDSALYYDANHITDAGSAMLAPYIREQLLSFLLPDIKK